MSGPYGVTRIVVVVPMCPAPELSPNARPHYQAKAKKVRQLRRGTGDGRIQGTIAAPQGRAAGGIHKKDIGMEGIAPE